MRTVVVGHTFFTIAMFGLMWTVQTVVYPQFRNVAAADFASYAAEHNTRIVPALVVLAPAEVIFAAWLWLDTPASLSRATVFVAGAILAVAWISTALWFGPFHGDFQGTYDLDRINLLISTNWIRTALWGARAAFSCWFLWQILQPDT